MADAIVCEGVVKIYQTATSRVQAVKGVDLRLPHGSAVAIVGPSGSGKSSLLRMIAGLSVPSAGRVRLNGTDLAELPPRKRRRRRSQMVAHVEQRPIDNLLPHLTVEDQVQRTADRRGADLGATVSVLDALHLNDRLGHRPHELSGGEQQRVAFARAAVGEAMLIVCDEPTAELDARSTTEVLDTIDSLSLRGSSILIATHDPRVIERVDTVVELRDGALASVTRQQETLAVIDGAGRLQLPPDIRAHFDDGTARLIWDADRDHLRVERS